MRVILKQIQVVIGHLNFACRVIAPGRVFSHRIAVATKGVTCAYHKIRVPDQIKEDTPVQSGGVCVSHSSMRYELLATPV